MSVCIQIESMSVCCEEFQLQQSFSITLFVERTFAMRMSEPEESSHLRQQKIGVVRFFGTGRNAQSVVVCDGVIVKGIHMFDVCARLKGKSIATTLQGGGVDTRFEII